MKLMIDFGIIMLIDIVRDIVIVIEEINILLELQRLKINKEN